MTSIHTWQQRSCSRSIISFQIQHELFLSFGIFQFNVKQRTKSIVHLDVLVWIWNTAFRQITHLDATARTVFTGMNTRRRAFQRTSVDASTKKHIMKKANLHRCLVRCKYLCVKGRRWEDNDKGEHVMKSLPCYFQKALLHVTMCWIISGDACRKLLK